MAARVDDRLGGGHTARVGRSTETGVANGTGQGEQGVGDGDGDPRRRLRLPPGRRLRRAVDPQGGRSTPACRCRRCTTTSARRAAWCSPCSSRRTVAGWPARPRCTRSDEPLWRRYEQACDFLEDDLESGYVRVLQEMIAAGWSDADDRRARRASLLAGWYELLTEVATEAAERFGGARSVHARRGRHPRSATCSSARRRCSCSGSTATQLPIRAGLRRVGGDPRAEARREPTDSDDASRQPDADGLVERDGVQLALARCSATGDADDRAAADVVDHAVPVLEAAGAVPGPPLPRRHLRRPWQRRVRAPVGADGVHPPASSPPTSRRCSTPPAPSAPSSVGLSRGALRAMQFAADHPERVAGRLIAIGPAVPLGAGTRPTRRSHSFDDRDRPTPRAGRSTTAATGSSDYERVPRVLLRADVPRTALDEADRGLRRLGARDRPGDARRRHARRSTTAGRTPFARDVSRGCAAPCSSSTATTTRSSPHAPRRRASPSSPGARSSPSTAAATDRRAATRSRVNRLIERVRRATVRTAVRDGARPGPAPLRRPKRALYLSSPIGLGHARRDVAIADELRAAATPTCRSTGSPSTRSRSVLEASGEHVHPASAWLANESAHIEDEAGEHDLHAFQAIRQHGRDPRQQLHGLPRRRRATSTTTS